MHQHSNYRGPRRRKEEIESEKNFEEIIVENFSNVGKEIVSQVQEALRVQYRINSRQNMLSHILIKLTKIKTVLKISKYTFFIDVPLISNP